MNSNGKQNYDKFRRVIAFVFGVAVLLTSLFFSKEGFSFKVADESIWWVGWVIAGAVSAAQFMFNTERKELDWTIVLVGLTAYVYSIWSNVQGWESLRGVQDYMNWAGGIFMDVFPEKAIAWSLGAIKVGDFVGNFLSVLKNPEKLDGQVSASDGSGKRIGNREEHIRTLQAKHRTNGQPPKSDYSGTPTYPPVSPNNPQSGRKVVAETSMKRYRDEPDVPAFMKQIMKDADRAIRS